MKKNVVIDMLDIILIPLITYLLAGFLAIQLFAATFDSTLYVVWGVMAAVILGAQKLFANKVVSAGIIVYAAGIIWWLVFVAEEGITHAIFICISFVAITVLRIAMQKRLVKIVIGYLVMCILVCCCIVDIVFSKIVIAFTILLFLNAVSETLAYFYAGNVKSLIVIYALIAFITPAMPVSEEPYGWDFVFEFIATAKNAVDAIVTEINYRFMDAGLDGVFHFGRSGYSDSQMDLSLGHTEQNVEQLILHGSRTKRHLYLRGNVTNEYLGDTWATNLEYETLDYRIDTLMTLYAIFERTDDITVLRKFMDVKTHTITQQNIKTKSLFYPIKALGISVSDAVSTGDFLQASQVNGRGYSYSYYFVDLDYSNSQLIEILKNSKDIVYDKDTYNKIYTNLKELYEIEIAKIPFEQFCQMAQKSVEMAEKDYTKSGKGVSDAVKQLSHELTKGLKADYEKCKTLEKYMYKYTYNKAVVIPEGVNILDWFLFEGQEGYCAHYATALAIMLREEGIPSRVVEGFLVDYTDTLSGSIYSVSSEKAHVWVEAYIEGFGWIRLEPTVTNAVNANMIWYSEVIDQEVYEEEPEEEVAAQEEDASEKLKQKMSWMLMLKLLGGMVVILVILLGGLLVYRRILILRSSNPDTVFLHMLSVMEKRFCAKEKSETINEYFARLTKGEEVPEDMKEKLVNVGKIMETYWYGGGSVSDEVITDMKQISKM